MAIHRHKASGEFEEAFSGCCRPYKCEPGAHGNIARHERCYCGAVRITNINGPWKETTGWFDPKGKVRS